MKGKYSSARDESLHRMCVDGWANDSTGSDEYGGSTWLIINTPDEMPEVIEAFDVPYPAHSPQQMIGSFLVIETDQGFVSVVEYDTEAEARGQFRVMERDFNEWLAQAAD